MRFALLALSAALAAGGIGSPPVAAPAQASLLPQIEEARIHAESQAPGYSGMTKHYVEVTDGVYVAVHGARERRQVRFARWVDSLTGDRLTIYEAEGFPRHRLRENASGVVTERWSYPDAGRVYVFRDGELIETRRQ